jgi:4-amino-4-deoxy-L-arabinose transferase-like glycosyltransferase
MRICSKKFAGIACLLLLTAAWKFFLLIKDAVPFNADEAVVALMARHILQGERPVFFYGQAYMGSLDAWLVAAGFGLFGQQVWVIRLIQILLYCGVVLTTVEIGVSCFKSLRTGLLAGALVAVPTVNAALYTTASLGGYGEALLLGNLILLLTLWIGSRLSAARSLALPWMAIFILGLCMGLGVWANGLTLVYSIPAGGYLFYTLLRAKKWRAPYTGKLILVGLVGCLAGSMPWWLYALQNSPARLMAELFGGAVAVERGSWLAQVGSHFINFLLLGCTALLGFRPPWEVRWLAVPLIPFILAFWLGVMFWLGQKLVRPGNERPIYALLAGVMGMVTAGFLFTPFGIDPSGRYFLPMIVPLALFAVQWVTFYLRSVKWQIACIGILVLFQGWGTLDCANRFPPGMTTQFYEPSIIDHRYDGELIRFLRDAGETRGYTNYWVAYPLAFLSQEEFIFIPSLPYHLDLSYTSRDDRYAPYRDTVNTSERTAYITTRNPRLDDQLRDNFRRLGVSWKETKIGDYQVFYRLLRAVRPPELMIAPGQALNP